MNERLLLSVPWYVSSSKETSQVFLIADCVDLA